MDRSSLKSFPCVAAGEGEGLFCQLNQIYWKLQEMDRSSLKIFTALVAGVGEGGGFSAKSHSKVPVRDIC